MSNPIEEYKKTLRKSPLDGLDIENEYIAIKGGYSKHSSLMRKRIIWAKETDDQLTITNEAKEKFEVEQEKLRKMLKERPE